MLASRCTACGLDYLPPLLFCEDCFAELSEFVDVPPEGRVAAVTMAHLDRRGTPLSRPQVWALVTFEGIRGGLVHRLLVPPAKARVGLAVRATLTAPGDRVGPVPDLD